MVKRANGRIKVGAEKEAEAFEGRGDAGNEGVNRGGERGGGGSGGGGGGRGSDRGEAETEVNFKGKDDGDDEDVIKRDLFTARNHVNILNQNVI